MDCDRLTQLENQAQNIIKECMNLSTRIKAKERDVEMALDQEKLQWLLELKFHDNRNRAPAVIFKDEIVLE